MTDERDDEAAFWKLLGEMQTTDPMFSVLMAVTDRYAGADADPTSVEILPHEVTYGLEGQPAEAYVVEPVIKVGAETADDLMGLPEGVVVVPVAMDEEFYTQLWQAHSHVVDHGCEWGMGVLLSWAEMAVLAFMPHFENVENDDGPDEFFEGWPF
jgi:hypothetical protein